MLSIVLPAYNEEQAIEGVVQACLDARDSIVRDTDVSDVEIIVVSDGSTDRTEAIARGLLPRIRLIAYADNRGYGQALKMGFAAARGDLLAFMDADGTCDPRDFAPMIQALEAQGADICLGNRLTARSHMPAVRRAGNRAYAALLRLLGAGRVTDTASGMRVLRRACLDSLYPLPDGLHFTPAMSCRALLDPALSIVESPISYSERIGRSKLNVLRDGFRFLSAIWNVSITYRAFRILGAAGALMMLISFMYGLPLLVRYAQARQVSDGMIYRLAFIVAVGVGGLTLFNIGLLASRLISLVRTRGGQGAAPLRIINSTSMWVFGALCLGAALLINKNAIYQYASMRKVLVHWSAVMTGAFLVLLGIQSLAFAVLDRVISLLRARFSEPDISGEARRCEITEP